MKQEKAIRAIDSAISNLEDSAKDLVEKNEKGMLGHVWQAAADSEYALFLFSFMQPEGFEGSSWKSSFHLKKVQIGPAVVLAQNLLKEAKKNIEKDDLHEAYKKTWMARGYLLKIWNMFQEIELKKVKERKH